jgi:hypothetical protein
VRVQANLTEQRRGGSERLFVVDRLTLHRAIGARSRPPARARTLDCPSCGAPLEARRGDTCTYCGQTVAPGRFEWAVMHVARLQATAKPALHSGTVEEQGTERPTVLDPTADARLGELRARDPSFDPNAFTARVGLVFGSLQSAWTSHSLELARAFVGDNLFESLAAQLEEQRAASVRNVTENTRVLRVELANVLTDVFYDAVTVRVFATGLDYTLDASGRVVAGSRTRERPYSEYWTMLRARSRTGPTRTDASCPSCGAPLRVNAAGHCDYCRAKVTTGEFDWVLSRIEQDDAYGG